MWRYGYVEIWVIISMMVICNANAIVIIIEHDERRLSFLIHR